jgi:hypothetical protein
MNQQLINMKENKERVEDKLQALTNKLIEVERLEKLSHDQYVLDLKSKLENKIHEFDALLKERNQLEMQI